MLCLALPLWGFQYFKFGTGISLFLPRTQIIHKQCHAFHDLIPAIPISLNSWTIIRYLYFFLVNSYFLQKQPVPGQYWDQEKFCFPSISSRTASPSSLCPSLCFWVILPSILLAVNNTINYPEGVCSMEKIFFLHVFCSLILILL